MYDRYFEDIFDEFNEEYIDRLFHQSDDFSRDLQRVMRTVQRTPIAVGEIVRDSSSSRDRGRGELVRRRQYNRKQNRLLVSHDSKGRVFSEIYDPNMRRVVPRTLIGNLPVGVSSTENNVRIFLNQLFGTSFVHSTQRRRTRDRHGKGPDLVPQRFDEFYTHDEFSFPLPCVLDYRCYKGTDPDTGISQCLNRSCPGRCRFGMLGECCCDE